MSNSNQKKFPSQITSAGIVSALLIIMFVLGLASIWNESLTTDEIIHIPAGYSYVKYQDFRYNPEHPPLFKALAGIPLMAGNWNFPLDKPVWTEPFKDMQDFGLKQIELGAHFIYGNDHRQIVFLSRIPMILASLLLGFFIYKWTRELAEKKFKPSYARLAGFFALGLYVFSPNILAHSGLVTTDIPATLGFIIPIYYLVKFLKQPGPLNALWAGLALGFGLLAKFSNFLLLPLFALLLGIIIVLSLKKLSKSGIIQWLKKVNIYLLYSGAICLIAILLIGIVYAVFVKNYPLEHQHKFIDVVDVKVQEEIQKHPSFLLDVLPTGRVLHQMADVPVLRPYAHYLMGFAMVMSRVGGGNIVYLLGETTDQSFPLYFPVVFVTKVPVAILILILVSLVFAFYKIFTSSFLRKLFSPKLKHVWAYLSNLGKIYFAEIAMLIFIFVYTFVTIRGNLNIGFRHLLPIMPFVFILVSISIFELLALFKNRKKFTKYLVFKQVVIGLIAWLIIANLVAFPSYLSYYNELAGGPQNGYNITVDSNLDWGQSLIRLNQWLELRGIDKVYTDCVGLAPPYLGDKFLEWHAHFGKKPGWFAISATMLRFNQYLADKHGTPDYSWLLQKEPVAIIDNSILVFYVGEDDERLK